MKRLCILILLLSGCAATPSDPWQDLTVDTKPAAQPIDCGLFPDPTEVIGDSVVYDNAAINELQDYWQCSDDNEEIIVLHAAQIAELKIARKELVAAGQAQKHLTDMAREALKDERLHNAAMSIGYWVIIFAMGMAM